MSRNIKPKDLYCGLPRKWPISFKTRRVIYDLIGREVPLCCPYPYFVKYKDWSILLKWSYFLNRIKMKRKLGYDKGPASWHCIQ